jgi:MFS family permease
MTGKNQDRRGRTRPGWMRPGWMRPGWMRPGWMRPGWMRPGWMRPGWMRRGRVRRGRVRRLGADLRPLRTSRDFRLVFTSRTVTLFGSQATEVALLVQARQLTGSAVAVGLLGAAELVPLVVFGLYGGTLADRVDRRRLIRWCEAGLGGCAALLVANASLPHPAVWPLYVVAASMMALAALQRPSLDASVPRVVRSDQLTAASALLGLSSNASFIAGSALGGVLAAAPGPQAVYLLDAASFAVSLGFLGWLGPLPAPAAPGGDATEPAPGRSGLRDLLAGVRYAWGRPELIGSYLVDLSAMTLAYPNALFPFLAAELHAPWAVGLMFAAPSAGAACASAASCWTGRVRRHGRAIALAAAVWGLAITALGFAPDIAAALAFLVLAGGADMLSGVFRDTLWNQTIPDRLRGRLAGVELLSYGLGPSAGQIRAGGVASLTTPRFSLWSGGLACVAAIGVTCAAFPGLLRYRATAASQANSPAPSPTSGLDS